MKDISVDCPSHTMEIVENYDTGYLTSCNHCGKTCYHDDISLVKIIKRVVRFIF